MRASDGLGSIHVEIDPSEWYKEGLMKSAYPGGTQQRRLGNGIKRRLVKTKEE